MNSSLANDRPCFVSHAPRNHNPRAFASLAGGWICCVAFACVAMASGDRPGEPLVIDHGLAPDGHYVVAASVPAPGSDARFQLLVVDAKTRQRLDTLPAVKVVQDTAAKSFHAAWSPDSQHVIVYYRVDEHITDLLLYRIADGRAEPLATPPDLVYVVPGAKTLASAKLSMFNVEAHWTSASRFVVRQVSQFINVVPRPAAALRKYTQAFTDDTPDDSPPPPNGPFIVQFSAEGVCELIREGGSRVVSVHPLSKKR